MSSRAAKKLFQALVNAEEAATKEQSSASFKGRLQQARSMPDGSNISLIAHTVGLHAEDFDPFVICYGYACVILIEALQCMQASAQPTLAGGSLP